MTSFKARVEQSSLGTRGGQAARRTIPTKTAAQVIARAATLGRSSSVRGKKK